MLALMLLVRPGYSEIRRSGKARRSWTSIQQEELQLQALAALATVAPLMLDEYMACQANTCLLVLLDWCTQKGSGHTLGKQPEQIILTRHSILQPDLCFNSVLKVSCPDPFSSIILGVILLHLLVKYILGALRLFKVKSENVRTRVFYNVV